MTAKLVLSAQMVAHAHAAEAWWRQNRMAAPDLFAAELEKVLALITEQPAVGRPTPRAEYPNLRRFELRRSRYYVLYEHDAATNELYVHAVWSAVRARGPRLVPR